jgi:hypothetical protein
MSLRFTPVNMFRICVIAVPAYATQRMRLHSLVLRKPRAYAAVNSLIPQVFAVLTKSIDLTCGTNRGKLYLKARFPDEHSRQ